VALYLYRDILTTMKNIFFVFLSVAMLACNEDGADISQTVNNPVNDQIEADNLRLKRELEDLKSGIDDYASYFNEVKSNLDSIKKVQGVISTKIDGDEKIDKADLLEDIKMLGELMTKNQERINQLRRSLKAANVQSSEMEKMIMSLTEEVALKNMEIYNLQQELETIDAAYTEVLEAYQEKVEELAQTTQELNTAFFTFGTSKELKENGVITKEGGFIGIGKIERLRSDFNKKYFTEIDIMSTRKIPLGVAKAEILTTHPQDSYELVGEKNIERLEIKKPKEFWSVSKYLVIVVE
jgi:predicted  nucleic acid-binding Zn-ribbon protein